MCHLHFSGILSADNNLNQNVSHPVPFVPNDNKFIMSKIEIIASFHYLFSLVSVSNPSFSPAIRKVLMFEIYHHFSLVRWQKLRSLN